MARSLLAAAEAATIRCAIAGSEGVTQWIGTHNGTFHCDEALACAMLKLLPAFRDHGIVRTRDPAVLEQCDIVVDVGATYDAEARRFDHHQKTFDGTLDGFGTKLSSAGLVYKHYGEEVLAAALGADAPPQLAAVLREKVYKNFVEHIDGIDNGVPAADGRENYKITTTLSARVGRLNPSWNAPAGGEEAENAAFRRAMLLCGTELLEVVEDYATAWWPARELVAEAIAQRAAVHESGRIIKFTQFCPWVSHLHDLEREAGCEGQLLYALFQDSRGSWRVQCVPEEQGQFVNRHSLLEAWRGLRDAELSEASGIPGCVFVHAAGFIGGNATEEGALAMAVASLP